MCILFALAALCGMLANDSGTGLSIKESYYVNLANKLNVNEYKVITDHVNLSHNIATMLMEEICTSGAGPIMINATQSLTNKQYLKWIDSNASLVSKLLDNMKKYDICILSYYASPDYDKENNSYEYPIALDFSLFQLQEQRKIYFIQAAERQEPIGSYGDLDHYLVSMDSLTDLGMSCSLLTVEIAFERSKKSKGSPGSLALSWIVPKNYLQEVHDYKTVDKVVGKRMIQKGFKLSKSGKAIVKS